VLVQISQQPKAKSQQPNKKHFANSTKTPIFVPDIMTYNDYYPFGALMPTRHESSAAYRYGYQGSEKDDEVKGSGNQYTTFYRGLDVRLEKWLSVDPKSSLTPWESPYVSMGNNPIWRNDILGDKWKTKADEKKASSLNKSLGSRIKRLRKRADRLQARADRKRAKGKEDKANKLMAKADDARAGVTELSQAQKELTKLGDVKIKREFTFKRRSEGNISHTTMDKNGTVVIEYSSDANAIHELTHAYQHLTGQVELVPGTDFARYYDITDEQQAYRRQFFFSPYSVKGLDSKSSIRIKTSVDIKADWISKIYYSDENGIEVYPYKKLWNIPVNKPGS
jgi:RHS repeat-associated protein